MSAPASPDARRFLKWLRLGMSGCGFAQQLADEAKGLLWLSTLSVLDDEDIEVFERILDNATEKKAVVVAVLPSLRTHDDVVELVTSLARRPRWTATTRQYACAVDGCSALELVWSSTEDWCATVMGFAPFGEMPISRRAPHVALAISAGGKNNKFFNLGEPGRVNMAHARHDLNEAKHRTTWRKTEADVAALFSDPPEDSKALRRISFCLPDVALARLRL